MIMPYHVIKQFMREAPHARIVTFTLTRRNVARSALLDDLAKMDHAYDLLMRLGCRTVALGHFRHAEVRFPAPELTHPHFHCLMMVRPTYFRKFPGQWVDVRDLSNMWGMALGVDYLPIANMAAIRLGDHEGLARWCRYLKRPPKEINGFQVSKFGGGLAEVESRLLQQAQGEVDYVRKRAEENLFRRVGHDGRRP